MPENRDSRLTPSWYDRGMVTIATVPPRIENAEKAAEAIAAQGVSQVMLFGSIARGDAGPDSDIDLVAIHDDLDYSIRRQKAEEPARLASAVTRRRVFVHVTDWPEWARQVGPHRRRSIHGIGPNTAARAVEI